MRSRVRDLSESDAWPELSATHNPIERLARRFSATYGRRFEEPPYLPADTLADAVYFMIYSELWGHVAMRRLAQAIARESATDPVFLEVSTNRIGYLNGYAETEFELIVLYVELRRLGVNTFLCEFTDPGGLPASGLTLEPSRNFMQVQPPLSGPVTAGSGVAIVPAGIRSVSRVIEDLQQPLVYSSAWIVPDYAYERSSRSRIKPAASFLPPRQLLPEIRFDFLRTSVILRGTQLSVEQPIPVEVPVEESGPLDNDWIGWLGRVMQGYIRELARRCQTEVAQRGLSEAHVADHLFAESSVFAAAVKVRGGRVILWPHSTNPAHVDTRRPGSFDVVHAITKTGCDEWRRRFPDAEVVHSPSLMLTASDAGFVVDPNAPLSVVVIGAKNTLGAMPFVHQSLHEKSYRQFFAGLDALQEEARIDVFYKPKGNVGENQAWLERVVGDSARWQGITKHPLKIELPNMLFVSISVGSGALLEGLSRGIPCVIVKDFPAREYLALAPGVIPTGPIDEMLEIVRTCTESSGLGRFAEQQLERFARERRVAALRA